MEIHKAYNLKLHESCVVGCLVYTRTIGGWIVSVKGEEAITFVPLSREFAPKSNSQDNSKMFEEFIDWFNKTTSRKFRYTSEYRKMFNARVKEGFVMEDFKKATKAMLKNGWVVKNKQQHPVHLLRPANFQRYLNETPQGVDDDKPKTINYAGY